MNAAHKALELACHAFWERVRQKYDLKYNLEHRCFEELSSMNSSCGEELPSHPLRSNNYA